VAGAAAFSIKLNAGAFAFAACTWVVVMMSRNERPLDRGLGVAATLATALGVWFTFGFALLTQDTLVHLLVCGIVAAATLGPFAHRLATARHPRTCHALLVLFGVFGALTAIWALPLVFKLGFAGFAHEVLLIGSGAAELYYLSHPAPEPYALAVTAGLALLAAVSLMVERRVLSPVVALGVATTAGVAALIALPRLVVMPEGPLHAVSQQLENGAFWIAPLVNLAGVAVCLRAAHRHGNSKLARARVTIAVLSVAMYLQLFPRTDFMHVIMAVPLTAVLASVLLERVLAAWALGEWPVGVDGARVCATVTVIAVLGVVALELSLAVPAALSAREVDTLDATRLRGLELEDTALDDLRAFGLAARHLTGATIPNENVLTFPATAGLLFASSRTSPVPHDYWFPGRPDRSDELKMVGSLAAASPRYIATLNDGWTFFIGSPPYFHVARDFARERYRLVARYGRFDLLARSDVAAAIAPVAWQPTGTRDAAVSGEMAARRQGARRWQATLEADDVEPRSLPSDVAEAVLLLRAIRDVPDLRTAGLLIAGSDSDSPRVREEARDAMALVVENLRAVLDRWAGDFDFQSLEKFVAPYAGDARRLSGSDDARVRRFGETLVAVLDGRDAVAGALR
jgi:hypothetical protein